MYIYCILFFSLRHPISLDYTFNLCGKIYARNSESDSVDSKTHNQKSVEKTKQI